MTRPRRERLRLRALIVAGLLACAFLGLLGRLAYLQVVKHEDYLRIADSQHAKTIPLRPKRGPIFDRGGQVLAVSSATESLFALPARVEDRAALAGRLAPILREPADEIAKRLASPKRFVFVKRKLPPPVVQAIRDLKEPALGFLDESLRLYPNRELAAHVVGFEGVDGRGLAGIEQAWDEHLAGQDGKALVERDALGPGGDGGAGGAAGPRVPARAWCSPWTPRSSTSRRRRSTRRGGARASKAAMAVALDPRTGEVLAVAIRPTFNPNSYATATDDERREPRGDRSLRAGLHVQGDPRRRRSRRGRGPAHRPVLRRARLDHVANATIHDWKPWGWLTFAEVLANSSNVGTIKVGLQLGKDRYYKYITGFGFGTPTGVGLPGESRGQLRPPQRWSGLSLATMSIGQEISVTALQIVSAFGAVANGGRLMQPQIVRAVLDADGHEVRRFEPKVIRQVISPGHRPDAHRAPRRRGPGRYRPQRRHRRATRSAERRAPRRSSIPRRGATRARPGVLSFVGFAPVDDPRIVMLVMLDEPKNEKWGSEAAAPIFAAIGQGGAPLPPRGARATPRRSRSSAPRAGWWPGTSRRSPPGPSSGAAPPGRRPPTRRPACRPAAPRRCRR